MMMMGGMGGSGGSMGMMDMDMMNMGMGNMQGMSNMQSMGNMQGMSNMQGMGNMQGMQGMGAMPYGSMPYGSMQGMDPNMAGMNHGAGVDPNAMAGVNHGTAAGSQGSLLGTGSFDLNSLLGTLLNLAIDIFAILLVVGLVVGAAVLIKRYLFDSDLLSPKAKAVCGNCGQALNAGWSCCPKCGQVKVVTQAAVTTNPQIA